MPSLGPGPSGRAEPQRRQRDGRPLSHRVHPLHRRGVCGVRHGAVALSHGRVWRPTLSQHYRARLYYRGRFVLDKSFATLEEATAEVEFARDLFHGQFDVARSGIMVNSRTPRKYG
jgi:hypothetical protein